MSGDWSSYLIFAVVIILLIWLYSRTRRKSRPDSNKTHSVISIISLIDENSKIYQKHLADKQSTKKFKTIEWGFYKDRLDYINPESVASLNTAFAKMAELNEKIEIALKTKDTAVLQNLSFDELQEPLSKGRQGMVLWLKDDINSQTFKRGGMFGF
jgi:hypothetical protein